MIRARTSYHSLTFLSMLLTLVLSAAPPPFLPQLLTPNTTALLPNSSDSKLTNTPLTYECAKRRSFREDTRATWVECYRAVRQLPTSYDTGTFHNGRPLDGYKLPVTEKFNRCRARVEIDERQRVESSWITLTAALDQLGVLCRRQVGSGQERVGGWMRVGEEGKIKVSLLGLGDDVGPEVAGALNGTAVE